jgi:hypothetical protein
MRIAPSSLLVLGRHGFEKSTNIDIDYVDAKECNREPNITSLINEK